MRILIDEKKNFYKASLHCHSKNSDGALTVEELKKEFKKHGYSVVAYTDHEHLLDNSHLDDEDFLTITSCELAIKQFSEQSTMKNFGMKVAHLNLYALNQHNVVTPCYNAVYDHFKNPNIEDRIKFVRDDYERIYSAEGISRLIKDANDAGFIVAYNHPTWSLENATDYLGYDGLFAVEIYNHSTDVAGGSSYCPNVLDDFLRNGTKIFCTMCDDSHNHHGVRGKDADMFGGWVMINAERLDYTTIMNCLQKGDFYATQGPEIKSLIYDGDKVSIKTSPSARIAYSTAGRRTEAVNAKENGAVTKAEFRVRSGDGYFRITVTDESGKHATTQAYFV